MTDSHAHLDQPAFGPDRRAVLARAARAGVSTVVSIGMLDGEGSWEDTFSLVDALHPDGADHSEEEAPQLFTTLGCHPHDARLFGELGGEERLAELARRPRLLAIGEVGLDYHYDLSPRPEQRDVFRRQIRTARELGLPVVVHHRDAEDDFLRIADEEDLAACGAILHCFTASERLARAAWERGFLISFSGILTFKNAEDLRRTAALVPLDHLLVETDSPYLAPVPHRGKRAEPAMVVETARALAAVRAAELEEIETATDANFRRFFFGTATPRPQGSAANPALSA
ncbi:MAG: TatD family deoxyribonuclease [Acidobacteria bacterium]|nr:TatD family deoxyribonuclease [Acidobacteriota bacterium]MYF13523.1 TatD family deoxyribonuclease [Acidobacteriota bacterium]MYI97477.1 TatD family deoxyribonuclease [Acidobacteriota bacterium]